ncbi:transcriptional regulator, LysR family [Chryseobacterium soldanellicola]|uniref:Transcriptional regulator, LysR family n=1 Tax=Chryseobacterium soldanellicola TaxID=311333 RepID=A0A1H1FNZ9_9FLAO|nr:LysR family transcriptional regulator [Chryseobacterium soldanellicola]SDR02615.1 transcriptional regulator, LysR family [Chryseobacterium soldanellicola]
MEIRHLKLIKAIVEEGGITKAIHKLHLTQSALSHQLKEAEQKLGTDIFIRSNKKLILTEAGEKLYATANEILDKLYSTQNEINNLIHGDTGTINLCSECFSGYHWLAPVLKKFNISYPKVNLNIAIHAANNALESLLDHSLDIALTTDVAENKNLEFIELFEDEIVLIVSENHHLASKEYVLANDFENENLIIHSLPLEKVTVYNSFLQPQNIVPKKIIPIPLTEASLSMIKAEMGIMTMPKWSAEQHLAINPTLKSIKIGENGLKRIQYISILKDVKNPDYFNKFIEYLKLELCELVN